ncbi:hypothetical protein F5Y03DRAFT_367548 [Xylaria venustula]|nr:hypothetical protein F5Y03DRAFT_367548 [Xylaria venustula]
MESDFIQYQSFGNGVRLHLITTIFICMSICLPANNYQPTILSYTILVLANLASVSIIIVIIIITLCISPALPCPIPLSPSFSPLCFMPSLVITPLDFQPIPNGNFSSVDEWMDGFVGPDLMGWNEARGSRDIHELATCARTRFGLAPAPIISIHIHTAELNLNLPFPFFLFLRRQAMHAAFSVPQRRLAPMLADLLANWLVG